MRVELAIATPGRAPSPAAATATIRRRFDPVEVALLLAFAVVSTWVLALDLYQSVAHGLVWTGTDGFFVVDQMQYLAWIRDASHHILASNLFVLNSTPADYFQPAVAISGVLAAIGVAPSLALLLWKPVAVLATFFAMRAFVYRLLERRAQRRAALALGLFFGSFSIVYGAFGLIGDLFPAFQSWGYPFGLMALAAMVAAVLSYDRARRENAISFTPAVFGALASSLHPWEGELLMIVLVGTELIGWRRQGASLRTWRSSAVLRERWKLLALTVAGTAAPLVYYAILGKLDSSWGLARDASKHSFSFLSICLTLAPLALPAALAYRRHATSFLGLFTRTWPFAALVVYAFSATQLGSAPLHAFEGITLPLAVLAVQGVSSLNWKRAAGPRLRVALVVAAVAAVTIPATAYEMSVAHEFMAPTPGNANFISSDERAALDYLNHVRLQGGVYTRFYLGSIVPAKTGRRTYVGNCVWSQPYCSNRAQIAQMVFEGSLPSSAARQFIADSGARFVLSDCQVPGNLTPVLAPITQSLKHFGCATVYELDPSSTEMAANPAARASAQTASDPSALALAESTNYAAVRAPRRQ